MNDSDTQPGFSAQLCSIYTTVDGEYQAMQLATQLVNEGLVACANVIPGIKSVYVYDGRVNLDNELVVIFKTSPDRRDDALARLRALHPYDVPCITVHVVTSADDYADWAKSVTRNSHLVIE